MNLIVNTLKGNEALINWDNVTLVTAPQNYTFGQVGDTGGCLEVQFTSRGSVLVSDTLEEMKEKVKLIK